ncbi:PfkB family carbohydrate kinase [Pararhizobium mangrovi]|uniref:Ribokinase n=1 Tax=Pararhizobium mangrovi TaxID=2590452 RepID=A0A506U640_9HYPH|nr:PfkB family carbohydrate kinase [Pararhizobium mangrovi]TPW28948.1 ribokinase [Pararhizobium mangrovi]
MKRPSILAFGDNVVDCYAEQDLMYPGGNCLNVAVFARRFGCDSAYAGAVADDPAGTLIVRSLEEERVEIASLRREAGHTAFCVIKTIDGERTFVGADLGVSIVAPTPYDLKRMTGVDAVHTGRSSQVDRWLGAIAERTRLSFDMATVRDIGEIESAAPHCFLLSLSGGDLSAHDALALSRKARSAGAQWVLTTRGAAGALLSGPYGTYETDADAISPLDTLGAGDTFIARTLAGLLRGEQITMLLREAAREAGRTCLHSGAIGHGRPIEIDRSRMKPISEIYASMEAIRQNRDELT